jgi:hypothetical protein
MNLILELVTGILRGLTKAALMVFTALFALAVLAIGLAIALATVIRYLLTGRKPAIFTTFSRFSQTAQQFRAGSWPGNAGGARHDSADVVDVQAHEVQPVLIDTVPSSPADGSRGR